MASIKWLLLVALAASAGTAPARRAPPGGVSRPTATPGARPTPDVPRPPDLPLDIPAAHWAAQVTLKAIGQGIVAIERDGRFHGDRVAGRTELARALYRVMVLRRVPRAPAGKARVPRDLAPSDDQREAVLYTLAAGMMSVRRGHFSGREPISREDLAFALSRSVSILRRDGESPVPHPVEVDDVAPDVPLHDAVQRCLRYRLISLQSGKFNGYLSISRYQLAAIAIRLLDLR